MKLRNGEHAVVSDDKLLRYVLNPHHPIGWPHALLFDRLLGINLTSAEVLREALLRAAREAEAIPGKPSGFGEKFEIRFSLAGPRGTYDVLSVWMIPNGTDVPHLVTAYIPK